MNRNNRNFWVFAVAWVVATAVVHGCVADHTYATNYYVDSAGGADSNSGTSVTAAWRSVAPVHKRQFQPGDGVYFKRGGSYGRLSIDDSGTEQRLILFAAYGSGPLPAFRSTAKYGGAVEVSGNWNTIDSLACYGTREAGVFVRGQENVIRNSDVTLCGTGILITGQYNLAVGNSVHDLVLITNTRGGDDDYGAVGIWVQGPNNEVAGNMILRCKAPSYDYGADGGGVELNGKCDNAYVHHNWVEGCNGFMEIGGGSARNVVIAYNVAIGNGNFLCPHLSGGFKSTVTNLRVENNTVVEPSPRYGLLFLGMESGFSSGVMSLRNNIFVTPGKVYTRGGFTHTNNLYWSSPGYSLGAAEKITDPKFIGDGNYRLRAGSPAIDAGATLGYEADYEGTPVGVKPDIGAYEFGG